MYQFSFSVVCKIEAQTKQDCKSSKTLLEGPRADSLWILKYKPDNLKGSLGHLEISEVQGLNQVSLDHFMFLLV